MLVSKSKLLILFSFLSFWALLAANLAHAALPPYFETRKEIIEILNNNIVTERIGSGRPIDSITKTEEGFTIVARECSLEVKIKYIPRNDNLVGPVNFEVIPGELKCKPLTNEDLDLKRN
jgi:hypothetical protein